MANYIVEDAENGIVRVEETVVTGTCTAEGLQADIDAIDSRMAVLAAEKSALQKKLTGVQAALTPIDE